MSDMECPFCQQELESVLQLAGAGGLVEEAYLLCSKCNIRGKRKLWQELIRTRKENEDKQAVLNYVVDMLKTLNQKYTLIMGKDVIKETVRLLEQKDVK